MSRIKFVAVVLPFKFAVPVTVRFCDNTVFDATERFDDNVVLPVTPRVDSVPSDVTLGCAAVANVPYKRFKVKMARRMRKSMPTHEEIEPYEKTAFKIVVKMISHKKSDFMIAPKSGMLNWL